MRELAKSLDLVTEEKKDSQGLCFIGKVKLPVFLQQALEPKQGDILEIAADHPDLELYGGDELESIVKAPVFPESDGLKVAEHQGAHYYTVGQRKGLHIGGRPLPSFVLGFDMDKNIIFSGQGENHPGLLRRGLFIPIEDIHWIREDLEMLPGDVRSYQMRIRYRQDLFNAELHMKENGLYVVFENPQKAVAAGQFAAWYQNDELLGSGVIS